MRRASSAVAIALGLLCLALISAGCRVTLPTASPSRRSDAPAPVDAAAAAVKDAALAKLLEPGPWRVETFLTTMLLPDVPSRDGRGEVDTLINRFRIRFGKQLGMGGFLTLESAYENRVYTFGSLEGVLPGTGVPSAAFHGVGLRVRYLQAVSERWAGFIFSRVRCEWEAGVSPIDGLSWVVSPGVGYRFDNGMNLGVGVALIDRIASDLLVIPGPQFTWQIDDCWSTSLLGTEFLLECQVSPQWKASFAAWFDSPRTRLHRLEPGNAGIFTDSRLPLQVRATWTPWECASIEARVGMDVYRELFFSDRHGIPVGSQPLDPALHFGLRWNMRF